MSVSMKEFLIALFPNIVSTLIFETSSKAYSHICSKRPLEKRIKNAFTRAIKRFYANPEQCGKESERKYEDYKQKFLQTYVSEASFYNDVQYKKLYELFEEEVSNDFILRTWALWQNAKYSKGKLDQIFETCKDVQHSLDGIKANQQAEHYLLEKMYNAISGPSGNAVTRRILPSLEESVKALKLSEAHKLLNDIRTELSSTPNIDFELMSEIDFLMGQCSRYVDKKAAITEYNLAYDEMLKSSSNNVRVIEGRIIALLLEGEKDEEVDAICKKSPFCESGSIWISIRDFLKTNNYEILLVLPEDVRNLVIANLLVLGTKIDLSQCYSLRDFKYDIPCEFTMDTIPLWVLFLTVSTARYHNYVGYDFSGLRQAPEIVHELKNVTEKYIEFSKTTELKGLMPDVKYMNIAMTYEIEKRPELLAEYEHCTYDSRNHEIYELFHASILSSLGKVDEAGAALDNCKGEDRTIVSDIAKCTLGAMSSKKEFAIQAFSNIAEKQYAMDTVSIVAPLICLVNWNDNLKSFIPEIQFEEETDKDLFVSASKCLELKDGNVSALIRHYPERPEQIKCLIAKCCQLSGVTKEGVSLLQEDIDTKAKSLFNAKYLELLASDPQYAVDEFRFLKELRANNCTCPEFLNREYILALNCSDYDDALLTANELRKMFPDNSRVYLSYLNVLAIKGDSESISSEMPVIKATLFKEDELDAVISILERFQYGADAVDMMYEIVQKHPSVKWKNFYCCHTYATRLGGIVNNDIPTVQRDSYVCVQIGSKGTSRWVDMSAEHEQYQFLLGASRSKFDAVINGKSETVEVKLIKSKYFKLQHEILQEVHDGVQGYSMKMFNADEMIKSKNPLEWLAEKVGHTEEDRKKEADNLREYKRGTLSIIPLLRQNDVASDYYNKIFGQFEILNHVNAFYKILLRDASIELCNQNFVLDITTVLLCYEFSRRFQYRLPFKPIVPKGLRDWIQYNKTIQECNLPSFIETEASDRTEMHNGYNHFAQRLGEIVNWIDTECNVIIAEKKLMIAPNLTNESFFSIEVESILLAYEENTFLLTEDWGLLHMIKGLRAINTHTVFSHLDPQNAAMISGFLKECHFKEIA